jgi:protein TonB
MDAPGAAAARAVTFRRRTRARRRRGVGLVPAPATARPRPGAVFPGGVSPETPRGRGVPAFLLSLALHLGAAVALLAPWQPAQRFPGLAPIPLRWVVAAEAPAPAAAERARRPAPSPPPRPRAARPAPSPRAAPAPLARHAPVNDEAAPAPVPVEPPVAAVAAEPPASEVAAAPAPPSGAAAGAVSAAPLPRGGYQVTPHYPRAARLRGAEGTALLRVRIAPDGDVAELRVERSSGHDDLDRSALRAVSRWRFEHPDSADADGVWVLIPVHFRLDLVSFEEES